MIILTDIETRILGCLIEKEATTPDNYPLTVNSLKNACNQKSAREPVMNLEEGLILRNLRDMKEKRWIIIEDFGRSAKYQHRLGRVLELEKPEIRILAVLLLRGAQTLNQIYTRVMRLYEFEDSQAVLEVLEVLIEHEQKFIIKLPKTVGEREYRYMHQLSGEIDISKVEQVRIENKLSPAEKRLIELEQKVADLTDRVDFLVEKLNITEI